MTCPDLEELELYLTGDAESPSEHIEGCPRCAERVEELRVHEDLCHELRALGDLAGTPGLEGYDLVREIGRGGMGVVYEAFHRATKRRVAVKTLPGRRSADSRSGRRFAREIELVADMRHPNIVTVHDSGTTIDGDLFFVMELVRGCDLRTFIDGLARDERTPTKLLELFCRICEPIAYAHRRGVIHRDLTPSNILVDEEGEPRIVDFGLAKDFRTPTASGLTLSGEFMGSLAWAAPEQVRGSTSALDVRIDVHALGLILNWLLTGETTYRVDASMAEAVRSILSDSPTPPSRRGAAGRYGADLDAIVLKALEKKADERYPSVEALLADCRRLLAGEAIEARRQTGWYRTRKAARRHPWLTAAVFALAAASGVALYSSKRSAERHAFEQSQSRVTQARLESAQGHTVRAEDLLWREMFFPPQTAALPKEPIAGLPDELRRSFWGLFELYARAPCVNTRQLGRPLAALTFRRSELVLVPLESETVELRTLPDLEVSRRLPHAAVVEGVTASPDERWLASWTEDEVFLWRDGVESPRMLKGTAGLVRDVRFDPDSRWLWASSAGDHRVHRWSPETGVEDTDGRIALGPDLVPDHLAWLNDRETLVVTETGEHRQGLSFFSPGGVLLDRVSVESSWSSWRTSADGRFLFTDQWQTRPVVFAMGDGLARTGIPQAEKAQHGRGFACVAPNMPVLACTGGANESIELRSLVRPRTSALQGHSTTVTPPGFSTDGRYLATCDVSGLLRLWSVRDELERIAREPTEGLVVESIAFDPGNRLVAAVGDGAVRLWSADTGRVVREWGVGLFPNGLDELPVVGFFCVAVHPEGRIVAGATNGSVYAWRTEGASEPELLFHHDSAPCDAAFDPEGRRLAVGWQQHLVVFDIRAEEVVLRREIDVGMMRTLTWSADGRSLLCAGTIYGTRPPRGFVLRVSLQDGDDEEESRPRAVRSITTHPSLPITVTADDDGRISLRADDASRWTSLEPRHEASVYSVAFTPDGSLLASGDRLGKVKIWDARTWEELAEVDAYPEPIFDLGFGPEGRVLAMAGIGQEVVFFRLDDVFERIARNVAHQRGVHDPEGSSPTARSIEAWAASTLDR